MILFLAVSADTVERQIEAAWNIQKGEYIMKTRTIVKTGIVSFLIALGTGAAFATDVRLHVIPLSNANGTNAYAVTPQQFASLIDRVNAVYAGTNIRFVFDPTTDWAPMADTDLNSDGADMRTRGNKIASTLPGKLVCFLRWGSQTARTGNGNAYPPPGANPKSQDVTDVEQDYVALPNQIESYPGAMITSTC